MIDKKKLIWKYALQNAVDYNGKANIGSVMGKIIAENPVLRQKATELKAEIEKVVKEINKLSPEKQREELKITGYVKKAKKIRKGMPPLKGARVGKVVTRFAPAPTGPLTIFHILRAASLSYLYAKRYKGKFILRFEDTDPESIRKEFYDMILEDLKAVGINPDKIIRESDHIPVFYKYMEQLIKEGKAYACSCSADRFKELKINKQDCPCRLRLIEENVDIWNGMIEGKYKPGEAVVRMKTSMNEPNPALRDPPLFRIMSGRHPIFGDKYKALPLYNFANVIEDRILGITHVFRGKEHEHNTAVQELIYKAFGWKPPIIINFGMIYFPGKKLHTRHIKEGIDSGRYSGWDDPALPTVRAFLRRGISPKALLKISMGCGLSKTDIRLDWENLEGINRKIIDPLANRYMVVIDPVKIKVHELSKKYAEISNHPDFPKRGKRKIPVTDTFYISGYDFQNFRGKEIRLIELGNVKLDRASAFIGEELKKDIQKVQWVSEPNIKVDIIMPDKVINGLGEPSMSNLKPGTIIQMIRVGFARVDSNNKKLILVWTHK